MTLKYVWNGFAQNATGDVLGGATVTVRDQDTNALSTLYTDKDGGTESDNPFLVGDSGQIAFYASSGRYKITAVKDSDTVTFENVVIGVPDDALQTVDTLAELPAAADYSGEVRYVDSVGLFKSNGSIWVNVEDYITVDMYDGDCAAAWEAASDKPFLLVGEHDITRTINIPANCTVIPINAVINVTGLAADYTICKGDGDVTFQLERVTAGTPANVTCRAVLDFTGSTNFVNLGEIQINGTDGPLGATGVACSQNPSKGNSANSQMGSWYFNNLFVGSLGQITGPCFTGSTWGTILTKDCIWDHWEKGNSFDDVFVAVFRGGAADAAENGITHTKDSSVYSGSTYGKMFIRPQNEGVGTYAKAGISLGLNCTLVAQSIYFEGEQARCLETSNVSTLVCPDIKFSTTLDVPVDSDGDKSAFLLDNLTTRLNVGFNRRYTGSSNLDCVIKIRCASDSLFQRNVTADVSSDSTSTPQFIKYGGTFASRSDQVDVRYHDGELSYWYDGANQHSSPLIPNGLRSYIIDGVGELELEINRSFVRATNSTGNLRAVVIPDEPSSDMIGAKSVIVFDAPATLSLQDGFNRYTSAQWDNGYFRSISPFNRRVIGGGIGYLDVTCETDGTTFYWQEKDSSGFTNQPFFGTHDGSDNAATLTDTSEHWVVDSLVGYTVSNTTDGSSGTITANTATTVTATLSGGTDNDWDIGDSYSIS